MSAPTFTPKDPNEAEAFAIDFSLNLAPNEKIVSATVVVLLKGATVDPNVGTMAVGTPGINGPIVTQLVQGGVDGGYYYVVVTATTSAGQVIVGRAVIPVLTQL